MSYSDSLLRVQATINGRTVDAVACSFRGAHFFVKNNEESGFGRTIVTKKIAFSGDAVREDLGENVSSLSMNIFLFGNDCDEQLKNLKKACGKEGVSELTHPWLGKLNVICKNLSVRYGTERLGFIEGTISFEKISVVSERSVKVNLATQTDNSASSFADSQCKVFSAVFKVSKLAKSVVDKVATHLSNALDFVFASRESLNGVFEVLDEVNKMKAETSILLNSPDVLGKRLSELLEVTLDTFGIGDSKKDVDEYIAVSKIENPKDDYSGYSSFIYDLIRKISLAMIAKSLVRAEFVSVEEARDYQTKVSDAFENAIAKTDDPEAYIELNSLLSASLGYLRDVIANMAYVVEREVKVTDNILSLAYDTYRNVERVEEIIERNQIMNCMFVMPGKVKVLSK